MSTTYTPSGYQLANSYDFPALTGTDEYVSCTVVVQRVDEDDNTVSCYVTATLDITGQDAFTATMTMDSPPTGYHYVYIFFIYIDTIPVPPSMADSGACIANSNHINITYPTAFIGDYAVNSVIDVLQQQNDGSFVSIGTITGDATLAFDPTQLQIFELAATRTSDSEVFYGPPSLITTACPTARKGSGGGFWALMR